MSSPSKGGRNYKAEYAEAKRAYDDLKAKYLALVASTGGRSRRRSKGEDESASAQSVRDGLAARSEAMQLRGENAALASRVAELETELAAEASSRARLAKERDELQEQTKELEASMSASMESVASLSATMRQVAPLIEELEGLKVTHSRLLKSHTKVRKRLDKKQEQLRLLRAELEAVDAESHGTGGSGGRAGSRGAEHSSPERLRMASALAAYSAGQDSKDLLDEVLAVPAVASAMEKAVMLAKMKCTMKSVETEALLLATLDEVNELKDQLRSLAKLNNELNAENIALLARITNRS